MRKISVSEMIHRLLYYNSDSSIKEVAKQLQVEALSNGRPGSGCVCSACAGLRMEVAGEYRLMWTKAKYG